MVALYDYAAQGPEDLEFSEGDTIDILGEGEALQVHLTLIGLLVESWEVFLSYLILSHTASSSVQV